MKNIRWQQYRKSILLIFVGGGIDSIGFIALFGFFTNHVTGNMVFAGSSWVNNDPGLWIKLAAIPIFIISVAIAKQFVDVQLKTKSKHTVLEHLFFIEAFFLCLFMLAGITFSPFDNPGSIYVGITAYLGMIALAMRNTSGKTLMTKFSPGTVMTGNTTGLGIDITNYLKNKSKSNKENLHHSIIKVISFILGSASGALLYVECQFWSVAFFIPFVLILAYLAGKQKILDI